MKKYNTVHKRRWKKGLPKQIDTKGSCHHPSSFQKKKFEDILHAETENNDHNEKKNVKAEYLAMTQGKSKVNNSTVYGKNVGLSYNLSIVLKENAFNSPIKG